MPELFARQRLANRARRLGVLLFGMRRAFRRPIYSHAASALRSAVIDQMSSAETRHTCGSRPHGNRDTVQHATRSALACLAILFGLSSFSVAQTAQDFSREAFAARDRQQFLLAVQLFGEALKQGQLTPEQRGLVLYGRGASYETVGLRDLALGDLDAAIALLPDFPNSYVYRALVWSSRKELQNALDDLLQAQKLNPNSALIYNNLGSVHELRGAPDLALENYGKAIQLDPAYAQAFYNRAHAFMVKRDYRASIRDYDRAIALQGNFAEAYSNRGGVYLLLGETDNALRDFNDAIRLKSGDPTYWSNRANAHMALGHYKDALADFSRAQSIDPGHTASYIGRGRARLYADEFPGAIEDLRLAGRLRPTNPNPAIWMHIARVHQGSPDREELERNAARVEPGQWPAQILDLYLGKLNADRVREDAGRGPAAEVERRLCEADFYVGEFLHHSDKRADGRRLLEAVIDRCRFMDVVLVAAKAELAGKPRP